MGGSAFGRAVSAGFHFASIELVTHVRTFLNVDDGLADVLHVVARSFERAADPSERDGAGSCIMCTIRLLSVVR